MVDESALPHPTHETTDVSLWVIWIGVPALIVTVVALALLVLWLFPGRTVDRTIHLPLPHYPSPELQPNPRAALREFRAARLKWLNSSGWIDRSRGIAHIPIAAAMREVANEGIADWPVRTSSPTTESAPGAGATAPAQPAADQAPASTTSAARVGPTPAPARAAARANSPAPQTNSAASGDHP